MSVLVVSDASEIKWNTAQTQKLREIIEAAANPIGSTPDGTSWCLKALHPSDPLTMVSGIPDQCTDTTCALNYQQLLDVPAPAGISASGTWTATILFMSDPVHFASIVTDDGAGHTASYVVLNSALYGTTEESKCGTYITNFQHWRVMYAGLTVHQSAPGLADQGVVASAQYPIRRQDLGCLRPWAAGMTTALQPSVSSREITRYDQGCAPTYGDLVKMPNAYVGESKHGVYIPLKLETNHIQWHTTTDIAFDASSWTISGDNLLPITTSGVTGFWPYIGSEQFYEHASTTTAVWSGDQHFRPASDVVSGTVFQGLSASATLNFVFRLGFENRVEPGSPYTSFCKVSPEHDIVAMTNYYKISRSLKDAYPVEYNDFGKLWDVIKGIASKVSPVLSLIPGGDIIRTVGSGIGTAIDAGIAMKAKRKTASKAAVAQPSAVDVEEAQDVARQAMKVTPRLLRERRKLTVKRR